MTVARCARVVEVSRVWRRGGGIMARGARARRVTNFLSPARTVSGAYGRGARALVTSRPPSVSPRSCARTHTHTATVCPTNSFTLNAVTDARVYLSRHFTATTPRHHYRRRRRQRPFTAAAAVTRSSLQTRPLGGRPVGLTVAFCRFLHSIISPPRKFSNKILAFFFFPVSFSSPPREFTSPRRRRVTENGNNPPPLPRVRDKIVIARLVLFVQ